MPHKTGIRLIGVAQNPANGFPARLLEALDNYAAMAANVKDRLQTMEEPERIETIRLLVDRAIVEEQGYRIVMALDMSREVSFEPLPRRKSLFPVHSLT